MKMHVWTQLVLVGLLMWAPGWVNASHFVHNCSNVGCIGTLDKCPNANEIITPNSTLNNCCPGCKLYLKENEACSVNNTIACLPGLACINNICSPSNNVTQRCQSYKFREEQLWRPKCEADGTYAPVQCKGERLTGRCFCYSKEGKRIFGQEWWSKSENMTCACSRRVEELKNATRGKLVDITLHCSADGNFEALQCSNGVCWCAEPRWGDALAEVVPKSMMDMLPCYNKTSVGSQYLRQCDSALSALNQIRIEMSSHGTLGDSFTSQNCGLDGTYGEVQVVGGSRYCKWKDNSIIGSYQASSEVAPKTVDCYCARDQKHFALEGHSWTLQCDNKGSYNEEQRDADGNPMCIDKDGFQYRKPNVTSDTTFTCK